MVEKEGVRVRSGGARVDDRLEGRRRGAEKEDISGARHPAGVKNCQCFGRLCKDGYICIELSEVGACPPP